MLSAALIAETAAFAALYTGSRYVQFCSVIGSVRFKRGPARSPLVTSDVIGDLFGDIFSPSFGV
jgi:hypothetical protein